MKRRNASLVTMAEAARLPFIRDERVGRWQTHRFTIDAEAHHIALLRAEFDDHSEQATARVVPPGNYVALQRRMTDDERQEAYVEATGPLAAHHDIDAVVPDHCCWVPVMSDTPAEISEHRHALLNATGRVLVTGLGLGCLPHALLSQDDVTRIDIIEIDPEVIALTGKYLTDGRVRIHRGDARYPLRHFKRGTRFDYCWHDIWSHVTSDNFEDETAEHGISFGYLFDTYQESLDVRSQGAWSVELAQEMRDIKERRHAEEREFEARLRAAPLEEQVDMTMEKIIRARMSVGDRRFTGALTPAIYAMFDPHGSIRAHVRKRFSSPTFWADYERERSAPLTPGKRPNAHLEQAT